MSEAKHEMLPVCDANFKSIDRSLERLETQINDIHDVVYKDGLCTNVAQNTDNLKRLMDNQTWLTRLVAGVFITAFIGLIMNLITILPAIIH